VGFGLSTLLKDLNIVESNLAYLVLAAVGLLDTWLLYRFFSVQLPEYKRAEELARSGPPPDAARPPTQWPKATSRSATAQE
jgi:hypothetical protein